MVSRGLVVSGLDQDFYFAECLCRVGWVERVFKPPTDGMLVFG